MKRNIEEISTEEWQSTLGEIGEEDLAGIRKEMAGQEIDFEADAALHRLLEEVVKETTTDGDDVPGLPDAVRRVLEIEKNEVFHRIAREEKEHERVIAEKMAEQRREARKQSPFAKFFRPVAIGWAATAALIAVGAFVLLNEYSQPNRDILAATDATVLTPGDKTGFTEPTFTWETDNGGIVKLVVADAATGKEVATLDRAFSPVRFTSMDTVATLQAGKSYTVRVVNAHDEDEVLTSREFATVDSAGGKPVRAADLDGVISQCRTFIAEGRAGDAWMLWAELSGVEKQDARMQDLKEEILAVLLG